MKKRKVMVWYDEEGDYMEIMLKKSKETYFDEVKKDVAKIIDKKTGGVIGYAIFNFTKRKEKFINIELAIPETVFA